MLRLAHAGAVANTTVGLIAEWFRDWKLPVADAWRKVAIPYYEQMATIRRAPQLRTPQGCPSGRLRRRGDARAGFARWAKG